MQYIFCVLTAEICFTNLIGFVCLAVKSNFGYFQIVAIWWWCSTVPSDFLEQQLGETRDMKRTDDKLGHICLSGSWCVAVADHFHHWHLQCIVTWMMKKQILVWYLWRYSPQNESSHPYIHRFFLNPVQNSLLFINVGDQIIYANGCIFLKD